MFQHQGNTYFAQDPPPPQNSTFSEHGHVAYQIKGNHECSKFVSKHLPAGSQGTPNSVVGSKGQNLTYS